MKEINSKIQHPKGQKDPGPGLSLSFNLELIKGERIKVIKIGRAGMQSQYVCSVVHETDKFVTVDLGNYKETLDKFDIQRNRITIERLGDEMRKKLEGPSKEALAEICKGCKTSNEAAKAVAKKFIVSMSTAKRWINEAGMKFGNSIQNEIAPTNIQEETPSANLITKEESFSKSDDLCPDAKEPEKEPAVKFSLTMSTYQIGKGVILVDYQRETIKFIEAEFSYDEAAAVVQLINEIL
jgi:hypothetical protein